MRKFLLPIIVVIAAVLYSSVVVVTEGTRGIMLRFNKVQRDAENKVVVYEPGLHFKLPLIDSIKVLDARIRTLDGSATRFVTVEKKDLLVDSYVKWKISDFGRFYTATGGGDYNQASSLLSRKVNDRLRSEIGTRTIKDIVSGTRGELMAGAKKALNSGQDSTSELGIEVVDVRVNKSIYRMKFLLRFTNVCVQNVMRLPVNTVHKVKKKRRSFKRMWIVKSP